MHSRHGLVAGLLVVALTTMLIVHAPESRAPSKRDSRRESGRYDELDGLESQWAEVLNIPNPTNVDGRCCGHRQPSETWSAKAT